MKVVFIKDHMENLSGAEVEVDEDRARYFISCGIAEETKEQKKEKVEKNSNGTNKK